MTSFSAANINKTCLRVFRAPEAAGVLSNWPIGTDISHQTSVVIKYRYSRCSSLKNNLKRGSVLCHRLRLHRRCSRP
ncbi:unnamed protein product, partial [Iphiclides podalirius]